MMLVEQNEIVRNNPILIVRDEEMDIHYVKGLILFFHGFKGAKESNLRELKNLASAGYIALGVDAIGHGDRRYKDFEQRFSPENPKAGKEFINVVKQTANEIPTLLDWVNDKYASVALKVGVAGISMGGYIAYATVLRDDRIKTVVSILGSPIWEYFSEQSPMNNLSAFSEVALLSMNAGRDELVPAKHARDFHIALGEKFEGYENRFEYIEYPRSGHFMEDEDWNKCWKRTLGWFDAHLANTTT
jgi:hypothetical protein